MTHALIVNFAGGAVANYGPFVLRDDAERYAARLRLPDNASWQVVFLAYPDWTTQWSA